MRDVFIRGYVHICMSDPHQRSIDFVSQADFLAHRGYYARVVKVLTGMIGIIEWGFAGIDTRYEIILI